MSRPKPILALAAALAAAPASAGISDSWPIVAQAESADCALTVTGNGKFYRIAATGYTPGTARLRLANADMKPIDRAVRIDSTGRFSDYYLPFLWHHESGFVTLTVASPSCALTVDFPWTRAGTDSR